MSKENKQEEVNQEQEILTGLFTSVQKMLIKNEIDKLYLIGFDDIALVDPKDWTNELLDTLYLDERVTDNTRDYVFRFHDRDLKNINGDYISGYKYGRWHELYEFYLLKSIEYNKLSCVTKNVNNILDFNQIALDKGKPNTSHYLIKVSSDTLAKLKAFDYDLFVKLNEMNKRIDGPTLD